MRSRSLLIIRPDILKGRARKGKSYGKCWCVYLWTLLGVCGEIENEVAGMRFFPDRTNKINEVCSQDENMRSPHAMPSKDQNRIGGHWGGGSDATNNPEQCCKQVENICRCTQMDLA
eukprot:scaffold10210_cov79-Skeletonema_marinoi.AAC.1